MAAQTLTEKMKTHILLGSEGVEGNKRIVALYPIPEKDQETNKKDQGTNEKDQGTRVQAQLGSQSHATPVTNPATTCQTALKGQIPNPEFNQPNMYMMPQAQNHPIRQLRTTPKVTLKTRVL
jgi:hypothetical protein